MTLVAPPPPSPVPSWPLEQAGPAQFDYLIHFCGRAPWSSTTPLVPPEIRQMGPSQRLDEILWSRQLHGFPPFGAEPHHPAICLSESPPDHLQWLLSTRGWPPWGLIFTRQHVYDAGGAPAWHVRTDDYNRLSPEQKRWAARLDTSQENRSDWLFEREWRLPVAPERPTLELGTHNLVGILVGVAEWEPTTREFRTGNLIDGSTGELAYPDNPCATPEIRTGLPDLWNATPLRVAWDSTHGRFRSA